MRTELVSVPATRGEAQIRNARGFTWNPTDPANNMSAFALLRAEVRYRDGRFGSLNVRPGTWYAGDMAEVWLWASVGGPSVVAAFDWTDDADEKSESSLAPVPQGPVLVESIVKYAAGAVIQAAGTWFRLTRPTWARALTVAAYNSNPATPMTAAMVVSLRTIAPGEVPERSLYINSGITTSGTFGTPGEQVLFSFGGGYSAQGQNPGGSGPGECWREPGPPFDTTLFAFTAGQLHASQTLDVLARWSG